MKPIRTDKTNAVFKLPGGTEENDLPLTRDVDDYGHSIMSSTWSLDLQELALLNSGGKIELTVWGSQHPPVGVRVLDANGAAV